MIPPRHRPAGGRARCVLLALLATGLTPVTGQPFELPDGMAARNWILSPYFRSDYRYNNNIFYRSNAGDPESDRVATLTAGLVATMPFRNSGLSLSWESAYRDYGDNVFERNIDHRLDANFTLNFSSGDTLTVSDRFILGITDVQDLDIGGELTFAGEGYRDNRATVELSRTQPNRQGYSIRVARIDLNFDDEPAVQFFDFRGFESAFEYRSPLPAQKWLTASYELRRFDNFKRCPVQDPADPTCETPQLEIGVPYRQEVADSLLVGMRGRLGRDQPFFLKVGWGRFRYEDQPTAKEYDGPVLQGRWRLGLGSESSLDVLLLRRALPSNFDSYYIINELQTRFRRQWLGQSSYGSAVTYSRNRYGNVLTVTDGTFDCGGQLRRDVFFQGAAYVEWAPIDRMSIRMEGRHLSRSSSCAGSSYDSNEISTAISLGWF